MKGCLVHLKDDLLEMNEWKILFKANGKECNIHFFQNIFKDFRIYTNEREKKPYYNLHGRFSTQLISLYIISQFQGVGFSNSKMHDSVGT